MAKTLELKIATPEGVIWDEEVEQVTLPIAEGEITVLPDHAAIIADITEGDIVVLKDGEHIPFAVVGGFLRIDKPGAPVVILADFVEHVGDMSEEKIAAAQKRVEDRQKGLIDSEVDSAHLLAELQRSMTRASIHNKWKKRKYRKLKQ